MQQVDGLWTATGITAENHRTGHRTDFEVTDVRYLAALPAPLFSADSLSRGLPALKE